MTRWLTTCILAASLVLASGCGEKCPHVCYCCKSVTTQDGEAHCSDSRYTVIIPPSGGPICTSCKVSCERESPGTTAIACREYGALGEHAGCTVDK